MSSSEEEKLYGQVFSSYSSERDNSNDHDNSNERDNSNDHDNSNERDNSNDHDNSNDRDNSNVNDNYDDSSTNTYDEENKIGDDEIDKYYPHFDVYFDSESEYLFINKCLIMIYGHLPEYAYYQSNDEIENFWFDLDDNHFETIYMYLIENGFIDDDIIINEKKSMKEKVMDFVFLFFENRQ